MSILLEPAVAAGIAKGLVIVMALLVAALAVTGVRDRVQQKAKASRGP